MEIIRKGMDPALIKYVHRCERCTCFFKFEHDDCHSYSWPNAKVECPNCLVMHDLDLRRSTLHEE
jgi:hypothetical protein